MSGYTIAWIGWLAMFLAVEAGALISKTPGATFTSHVIRWASLREKPKGWLARRGVLFGILGWLVYHFAVRMG